MASWLGFGQQQQEQQQEQEGKAEQQLPSGMSSEAGFSWISVDPKEASTTSNSKVDGIEKKVIEEVEEVTDAESLPNQTPEGVPYEALGEATSDGDTQMSQGVNEHLGGAAVKETDSELSEGMVREVKEAATPVSQASGLAPALNVLYTQNAGALATAELTSDLETAVEAVWVPVMVNGVVSTESGVIRNLDAKDLTLRPGSLSEKLVGLMCSTNLDKMASGGADLLSWLLREEAFAKQIRAKELCGKLTSLVQDTDLQVVWTSLRLLRNLSKIQEYGEAVLESISRATWMDPTSQIYLCEISTNLAAFARAGPQGISCTWFSEVYDAVIAPVVNLLMVVKPDSEEAVDVLGRVLTSLNMLMCPKLITMFADKKFSGHQQYVWEAIHKTTTPSVRDPGLKLVDSLIASGYDPIIEQSGVSMDHVFELIGLGESWAEKIALSVACQLQKLRPHMFLKALESDKFGKLTKLHIVLETGTDEHKELSLQIMLDLFQRGEDLVWYGTSDLNFVTAVLELLRSPNTKLVDGALKALVLLIAKQTTMEEVTAQIVNSRALSDLAALMRMTNNMTSQDAYQIIFSVASKAEKQLLYKSGIIPAVVGIIMTGSEAYLDLAIPCLVKLLSGDAASMEVVMRVKLAKQVCSILSEKIRDDALELLLCLLQCRDVAVMIHEQCPHVMRNLLHSLDGTDSRQDVILPCIDVLVTSENGSSAEHWIDDKSLKIIERLLREGRREEKKHLLQIVGEVVGEIFSAQEQCFNIVRALCRLLPEFVGNKYVLLQICTILAAFGAYDIQLVARCILEGPPMVNSFYDALAEAGLPEHGSEAIMNILCSIRCLEKKAWQTELQILQDSSTQQLQTIADLQEGISLHEHVRNSEGHSPPDTTAINIALEQMREELQVLRDANDAKDEALDNAINEARTQASDAKVLMEVIEQQHQRISLLAVALGDGIHENSED